MPDERKTTGDYVLVPREVIAAAQKLSDIPHNSYARERLIKALTARPAHFAELQAANDAVIEAAIQAARTGCMTYELLDAITLRDKVLSTTRTET